MGHAYPALQFPEHAAVVKPVVDPKVPPGHAAVHALEFKAVVDPYRPAGHPVHCPALALLYWPAAQGIAVAFVDPAGHAYPAVQFPLQLATVMPAVAPKKPAAQTLHDPAPPVLYWPATHRDVVGDGDPAGHAYPAEQFPEHVAEDKPVTLPYVPAGQGAVHAAEFSPNDEP